jgi:uncharacterized membrane protein
LAGRLDWRKHLTVSGIKAEINLNTIVAVVGFLITFAGIITLWNQVQYKQQDFDKWIQSHEELHKQIAMDLASLHAVDSDRGGKMLDMAFKEGQLEKQFDALDARLSRMTESYGNQFSDIRTQLGAIATQLALTNQTLQGMAGIHVPPSTPETNPPAGGKIK